MLDHVVALEFAVNKHIDTAVLLHAHRFLCRFAKRQ